MFMFTVGLKLNLLDLTLAIDLQYLGVCLPIPPPVLLPGASSVSSASSQGEEHSSVKCFIKSLSPVLSVYFPLCLLYFLGFPVPFVSRTGKTTDVTKIKGWRDKFATSSSSLLPGGV